MEDAEIIDGYWQRNEAAIAQTNEKYGKYLYSIAHNVLDSTEDAKECINDTWFQAWNSIPPQRPMNLKLFLAKITRNLAFNKLEEKNAKKRGGGEIVLVLEELKQCIADSSDVESAVSLKELENSINRFVQTLSTKESNLFVRRYFYTETVKAIAKRYGLSENNVSVSLSRIRNRLKNYLKQEGYI